MSREAANTATLIGSVLVACALTGLAAAQERRGEDAAALKVADSARTLNPVA